MPECMNFRIIVKNIVFCVPKLCAYLFSEKWQNEVGFQNFTFILGILFCIKHAYFLKLIVAEHTLEV